MNFENEVAEIMDFFQTGPNPKPSDYFKSMREAAAHLEAIYNKAYKEGHEKALKELDL